MKDRLALAAFALLAIASAQRAPLHVRNHLHPDSSIIFHQPGLRPSIISQAEPPQPAGLEPISTQPSPALGSAASTGFNGPLPGAGSAAGTSFNGQLPGSDSAAGTSFNGQLPGSGSAAGTSFNRPLPGSGSAAGTSFNRPLPGSGSAAGTGFNERPQGPASSPQDGVPPPTVDQVRALVDLNPALHVLNERVISEAFAGQNEVVCTFCLLQVLAAAYQLGNSVVRAEIERALESAAPGRLGDTLLAAAAAEPTLSSMLAGYYQKGSLADCEKLQLPRTAAPEPPLQRCERIQAFVAGRGSAVDFADPQTTAFINGQVEKATGGRIRELFGELRADTRLVFASAMVFRDKWQSRLLAAPGVFRAASGNVSTELLSIRESLPLLDGSADGVIGVSLPYQSRAIRMFLFTTADGSPVGARLRRQHYQALAAAEDTYTRVTLPSFDMTSKKHSYVDLMQGLGMRELFIRGLGADDQLKVDQLVHKAVISTDQHGTEAAGAAGIALVPLSAKPTPFEARFDRPFVCSLVHTGLGVPLFTAYVANPSLQ